MPPNIAPELLAGLEARFGVPLSPRTRTRLLAGARLVELAAGEAFLAAGEPPGRVGIVLAGALREVLAAEDGRERTCGFAFEGDLVGAYADALAGRPSERRVETLAPARLLVLATDHVREMAGHEPDATLLLLRVTEHLYVRKARREHELLTMDAMARYAALLAEHPTIEARVALVHVASYLGITPVHLSRLRRRRRATPGRGSPTRG
jgi:CRP-like cAMP-binding protein